MWIHIGILFLVLAVFLNSIESHELNQVLERHMNTSGVGRGICTYLNEDRVYVDLNIEFLSRSHVMVGMFLIGISTKGKLRSIFDKDERFVIARAPTFENIILATQDIQDMPYKQNCRPSRTPLTNQQKSLLLCPNNVPSTSTVPPRPFRRSDSFTPSIGESRISGFMYQPQESPPPNRSRSSSPNRRSRSRSPRNRYLTRNPSSRYSSGSPSNRYDAGSPGNTFNSGHGSNEIERK